MRTVLGTTLEEAKALQAELDRQNKAMLAEQDRLQKEREALTAGTIKKGEAITASTTSDVIAAQAADVERIEAAKRFRKQAMILAGIGAVAVTGTVIMLNLQKNSR
jgi:hypothetical protein